MFKNIYNRYYVLHQSVRVCLAYFLDHDLWVCPPDMINLITLPFLRLFAWVGGWMGVQTTKHSGSVQNLTEKKQC
jgi:hypothetical protein